jgi:hypothetical protein
MFFISVDDSFWYIIFHQEEDDDLEDELEFLLLKEFHHETRVSALAWSPETSLSVLPKCLSFASAGADYKLRLFTSDLVASHTLQVVKTDTLLHGRFHLCCGFLSYGTL